MGIDAHEAKGVCYVLGAAMEGIIYQSIIRGSPDLREVGSDPEAIIQTIVWLWYRAIFLEAPSVALPTS